MDALAAAVGAMILAAIYTLGAWAWSKLRRKKGEDE